LKGLQDPGIDKAIPEPMPGGVRGSLRLGVPFVLLNFSVVAVFFVGWSAAAIVACVSMYLVRMFGITAFYHRYFSHRSFQVSRPVQLAGAVLGASAAQRGPLWWAAHHRRHHRATDRPGDPHSPKQDGFLAAHVLWMFAPANRGTDLAVVEDLARFPELRFLDRFHHLVPVATAAAVFLAGISLGVLWPGLHTSGLQLLVWGFCVSTVAIYHATFAINSVAHLAGTRRFETNDDSRNNWYLALATMGEGWHNNHHRFPGAARQGFSPWELDLTFVGLQLLSKLRLVRDLRPVPPKLLAIARTRAGGRPSPPGPARSTPQGVQTPVT
jgi:stearoyl-CoA desaturase (delta-9 desaturase)